MADPLAVAAQSARELRAMAIDMENVIDDVIGTRSGDGALECFESALRSLRSMRTVLQHEADKLDPKPAGAP